jgi:hypothetical protein
MTFKLHTVSICEGRGSAQEGSRTRCENLQTARRNHSHDPPVRSRRPTLRRPQGRDAAPRSDDCAKAPKGICGACRRRPGWQQTFIRERSRARLGYRAQAWPAPRLPHLRARLLLDVCHRRPRPWACGQRRGSSHLQIRTRSCGMDRACTAAEFKRGQGASWGHHQSRQRLSATAGSPKASILPVGARRARNEDPV